MKHLKLLLASLLIAIAASPVAAADGDDAMFGLRWGMSLADVKALGTTLTKTKGDRNLEIYSATSLPKNVSDMETYSLVFAGGKLVKVSAIGKDITSDPTGSTGKERFEAIARALTEKYGKPSNNYQSTGNKLFKEYDEFYQCLAYSGCGMWITIYESTDKSISLELKGLRRGTGYLVITTESTPQWAQALDVYKAKKTSSDKDAL